MGTPTSSPLDRPRGSAFPLPWLVPILAVVGTLAFLITTPHGFLTKMDMVGYAVCHRIPSHSFAIAGHQLPLCARCTGTFIGTLVGFVGQAALLRRRRAGEFPPAPILVILAGFTLLWAADGANSYLALIRGPHLYEPQNWLRLTTGALNGLTMSALVYPVFNFTLWRPPTSVGPHPTTVGPHPTTVGPHPTTVGPHPTTVGPPLTERTIRNLGDLGLLVLLEAGLIGLLLTRWSFLLYPLALLSALGVLALLTTVNSMLVLIIVRRENVAETWREAVVPLLAGFIVSLVQVGVIDIVRYMLTGTLSGIPPLG